MNRALVLAALIAICCIVSNNAHANRSIGELEFKDNLQTLIQSAQESEKSIVLKFYTDWCYWCKVMDDSTFPDVYVQKFLKNFELGMINAEVDTAVAARYGVRSYPTTLLLKSNGDEIDRFVGYIPPEEFVTSILNAYAGIGTLQYYLEKLKSDPQSAALTYEVGQKYRWQGDYDAAKNYFEQVIALDVGNSEGLAAQASYNIGHMQFKLKNYLAAVEEWRKTVAEFPGAAETENAEIMIAYSYQSAHDYDNARKEYNHFLEKHPDTEEREWINEQFTKMNEEASKN